MNKWMKERMFDPPCHRSCVPRSNELLYTRTDMIWWINAAVRMAHNSFVCESRQYDTWGGLLIGRWVPITFRAQSAVTRHDPMSTQARKDRASPSWLRLFLWNTVVCSLQGKSWQLSSAVLQNKLNRVDHAYAMLSVWVFAADNSICSETYTLSSKTIACACVEPHHWKVREGSATDFFDLGACRKTY